MKKRNKKKLIIGFVIVLVIFGSLVSLYKYNQQQNAITANAIMELEKQLVEQGELSEEQEARLEELAQVTCRDVEVPYEAQEEYTEQEPYSKTEEYYESEPREEEVCEDINLIYSKDTGTCQPYIDNYIFEDEPAKYDCTVSNLDSTAGTFSLEIGFILDGQRLIETQNQYIYAQSSHKFYAEKMAEIDSCFCTVINIPTKEVCEYVTIYRDVLKTRQVTDYRPVTKYRTITKYKTETVCD